MNFFFCVDDTNLKSVLSIPKFKNESNLNKKTQLFSLFIKKDRWQVGHPNCDSDDDFFYIDDKKHEKDTVYFLANFSEVKKLIKNKQIYNINNLTNTNPAFRANLEISNSFGGFSSYQSDYPYDMVKLNSGILSSVSILLDKSADNNIIYFRNIYYNPIKKNCIYYIINSNNKTILKKGIVQTNKTNKINIDKELIDEHNYFFTTDITGIPIFCNEKKHHLSFEHTHPPHHYILSDNRFILVKNLKEKFYDIIKKNI